jgi:hypothetical protein
VKGIKVYSSEGRHLSLRRDNGERVKLHKNYLQIFFSRTSGPISTRLDTNCTSGVGDIKVCENEGQRLSIWGDNSKRAKMHKIYLTIFFPRSSYFNQTWHK